jgi:predicted TIM-barrel fold metal-dependent hydrolase
LIEENPDRFIVGTDASHHSLEREKAKIASVSLLLNQLSPETRKKVAEENILRLIFR